MARNVIALLGGPPIVVEKEKAIEAIIPGHLLAYVGTGSNAGVGKHATVRGNAARRFALERTELGKGIADAYASGDYVAVGSFHQGQRVLAIVASGAAVAKGTYLESAGNGCLQAFTSGVVVAQAFVAQDDSQEAVAGYTRLPVEIV